MANPDEGEVEFVAKGNTYILSYPNRTLRSIEKQLKKPIGKLLADMQAGASVTELVTIFYAGLHQHHPKITEDEAADLVLMGQLLKLVNDGLLLAMGAEGPAASAANGDARPLEPSRGASTGSVN